MESSRGPAAAGAPPAAATGSIPDADGWDAAAAGPIPGAAGSRTTAGNRRRRPSRPLLRVWKTRAPRIGAPSLCLLLLGSVLGLSPAQLCRAQQDLAASCEEISTRCPEAVIGEVRLDRNEIFELSDPLPTWFPRGTVNRLHMDTTEATIRSNLLFQVGDRLDVERIRETQRKLNSLGYFQRESIHCQETSQGKVRVDVRLKENWSLIPILDFQGRGLGTAVTAGFSEQNLLGLGKILTFSYRKGAREANTIIEDAWRVSYEDPNLIGSEFRLSWTMEESESGKVLAASFEKPYFSLDTPWSMAVSNSYLERTGYLFLGGGIAADFHETSNVSEVELGAALKSRPAAVHRGRVFYRREDRIIQRFRRFTRPNPFAVRPPDYTLSYPGVGYRRLGVDYVREQRVRRFERDEYFNLANDLDCSVGYSAEALGAGGDEWVFSASDTQGYRFRPGHFFLVTVAAEGYLDGDRLHNGVARLSYNHYLMDTFLDAGPFRHTLHGETSLAYGKELDPDRLLGLGYTTGLRGYDAFAFTGNKLVRLTLEDRVFVKRQLFGLVSLGLVVFWDMGYAWLPGVDPELGDLRHDVGFGVRTAIPSASGGNVVRLNWGLPLGSGASPLEELVFTVTVGSTFD